MYEVKEKKPTPAQIADHAARVKWNHETIEKLGLTVKKNNGQTKSITVLQGNYRIFHEWSAINGQWENFTFHLKLEAFLKAYVDHVLNFPGVTEQGVASIARFPSDW